MAKRALPTKRPRVTPLTRGAHTTTTRLPQTFDPSKFPFKIPAPKGRAPNAEEALFSQPSDGVLTPAQQRMRQGQRERPHIPTAQELDDLGEADPNDLTADREMPFDGGEQDEDPDLGELPSRGIDSTERLEAEIAQLRAHVSTLLASRANAGAEQRPTAAAPQAPGITAHPVSFLDVDRLWDWIRSDSDRGQAFLGTAVETSLDLHQRIRQIQSHEAMGVAMVRSLYREGDTATGWHLGFLMLHPILSQERMAVVSMYLQRDSRGYELRILPAVLALAAQIVPGFKLAVMAADEGQRQAYAALLQPLGFTPHTMFVHS